MAKKQETKKVEEKLPQIQEEMVTKTTSVVEEPKVIRKEPSYKKAEDGWEIKDRTYFLKNKQKPLSYKIKTANIYWFDENKGFERELKYCENQKTCFVDEMQGDQRLEHVVFRAGNLLVPKEKVVLQKLLSLYHPHKNKLFQEYTPIKNAISQMEILEIEVEALMTAKNLDIDMAEAIMRVEIGSKVSDMSSKELKRDLLLFAKKNPGLFLDLVGDENIVLRNFGIRATEMGILKLSPDQRTFSWGSNDRKLMNVPFDEHPYSALAAWFKTDEGMEIYSNIEKRLN
ncbi:hypothetical protein [uncultured virus]|uniref:Uncharacterized protein n=1 Tax=uncultured virus TaxID=340016 RepID=A0A218MMJ2_9VIRU|nr:hypothetical protein [uncultured virus]